MNPGRVFAITSLLSLSLVLWACGEKQPIAAGSADESAVLSDSTPIDPIADTVSNRYLTGKFDPAAHPDFAVVPDSLADRSGLVLRKEALETLSAMVRAAKAEGHTITVISATRNFDYQKGIWERKWTGETILSNGKNAATDYTSDSLRAAAILLYSSMPGTSRHHWGTDFDINALNNDYFEKGEGSELFNWLEQHAAEYGFCRPYTAKGPERPFGYEEEKWHWSYQPLSAPFTRAAAIKLANSNISGFKGSDMAVTLDVVNRYILGISPVCK